MEVVQDGEAGDVLVRLDQGVLEVDQHARPGRNAATSGSGSTPGSRGSSTPRRVGLLVVSGCAEASR
jgi:hypothetical protein